jgi:hypothetical protein
MCDFSLHAVRSRPARVGDKLTTRLFNSGTTGFCAPEDEGMAICLLPGTEVSFAEQVRQGLKWLWKQRVISYKTAIFRQINRDKQGTHHDALKFPNGEVALLTTLSEGQLATILQLPAAPQSVTADEEAAASRTWRPFWLTRSIDSQHCNGDASRVDEDRPLGEPVD